MTPAVFVDVAQDLVLRLRCSLDSVRCRSIDPLAVEDLRALLRALHFALERLRESIANETGDHDL